jgi:hypothetical protein
MKGMHKFLKGNSLHLRIRFHWWDRPECRHCKGLSHPAGIIRYREV